MISTSRRNALLALTLTLAILAAGCDGILQGFRTGFAVGKPIVDDLVVQHVITQAAGDTIKADVQDGINAASTGEQCVSVATGTANEKKIAKAKCYFQVAQDLRAILNRHHIGGSDKLNLVAAIAQDVIVALEEYFRQVTGSESAIRRGAVAGDPDKALEGKMKAAKARLDALKK